MADGDARRGRTYLLGTEAGVADISAYHILWFLRTGGEKATDVLDDFPEVQAWMHVEQIGHGKPVDMRRRSARLRRSAQLRLANRTSTPNVQGLRAGDSVQVRAEFAGRDPTVGRLHISPAITLPSVSTAASVTSSYTCRARLRRHTRMRSR